MGFLDLIKKLAGASEPAVVLAENEPGSVTLYERCLGELAASPTHEYINIEGEGDAFIQVAGGGDGMYLNITSYPFDEAPDAHLGALGVPFPTGSSLDMWESSVYAQYAVPGSARQELAVTIDALFHKLYNAADGYCVSVSLDS
jgi:hypothetical protein